MSFCDLLGNDHVKGYLQQMLAKQTIGNALLFAGPEGVGKGLFARAFAKEVLQSSHAHPPDLHIYRPEGKTGMHPIATMRAFSEEVYMAPYEAKRKIFIIDDADRMLTYSANALLKTFEEPSDDTLIILVSSSPERLLPTVLSRCRTVHFHPVPQDQLASFLQDKGVAPEKAQNWATIARGSVSKALQLAAEGGDSKRNLLLEMLASGSHNHYGHLTTTIKQLTDQIEEKQKQLQESYAEELSEGFESLTALQKEGIQKEVEGMGSRTLHREADHLFSTLLYWFRDLHLLSNGGDPKLLFHPDHHIHLTHLLQKGTLLPLEKAQSLIQEAKLSLARSTSLNLCLEHFFLQLN